MNETIITLFGTIDRYCYGKNYIKYFLDKAQGNPVRLKVTSYGGDVAEAVAISNLLAEHGDVTVEFIGFNASAATWMAFGARSIEIHEDAMWLAHKSSIGVDIYGSLNVDQLEEKIRELENARKNAEAIDLMIAKKYADRCKKTVKDVIGLMSESRWMPSSEAKDWGFVDKVIPGINKRIQITDEIIGCFNAVGLPVPVLTEDNGAKSSGLVTQILESFKSFLSNKDVSLTNSITMRKEFQFINQLLNCEGVEEKDGKVSLTEENLKVINDGIKKAYNAQKKAEDDLAEVVNELDSLSDSIKDAAGNKAKVQVIRNIVSKIPGTSTISHQENDEDNKFADIATDPINRYENE
ncbi:Clp protease ClpP [Bacteroides helcogenes]|nr:Clp protease ClpP [Bacteroides helcogenes]